MVKKHNTSIVWAYRDGDTYDQTRQIHKIAAELMFNEDPIAAYEWMQEKHKLLDNNSPLEEIHAGRVERVFQLLESMMV